MGFRSTIVTQDYHLPLPEWFVDKYKDLLFMGIEGKFHLPVASMVEFKSYVGRGGEIEYDIQRVMREGGWSNGNIILVWLHECGGITRVEIYTDKILFSEPISWKQVEEISHDYCYGCSDVENIRKE